MNNYEEWMSSGECHVSKQAFVSTGIPRRGAGATVGALAKGRSRENREKMKNSPWGLSKS